MNQELIALHCRVSGVDAVIQHNDLMCGTTHSGRLFNVPALQNGNSSLQVGKGVELPVPKGLE